MKIKKNSITSFTTHFSTLERTAITAAERCKNEISGRICRKTGHAASMRTHQGFNGTMFANLVMNILAKN